MVNGYFENNFVGDAEKMADFVKLSKEEFLQSYDYLTGREYDETKAYFNYLINLINE